MGPPACSPQGDSHWQGSSHRQPPRPAISLANFPRSSWLLPHSLRKAAVPLPPRFKLAPPLPQHESPHACGEQKFRLELITPPAAPPAPRRKSGRQQLACVPPRISLSNHCLRLTKGLGNCWGSCMPPPRCATPSTCQGLTGTPAPPAPMQLSMGRPFPAPPG